VELPDSNQGVLVEFGREGDGFCPITQVRQRTVGLSMVEGDGKVLSASEEIVPQRLYTLMEIELLGKMAGFRVASTYGDFSLAVPLLKEGTSGEGMDDDDGEEDEAFRMLVCLVKEA
jgi:hypothetical protein